MFCINTGLPGLSIRAAAGLGALLVSTSGLCAGVINVPGDAPTIQGGIDLAVDGDEVLVAPGVYAESVDFLSKSIVLRSTDGADTTTIDAGGAEAFVVTVENVAGERGAFIDGFTITGGEGTTRGNVTTGGGVLVAGSTLTIEDSIFTANSNNGGGAILASGSTLVVRDSAFSGNSANSGGAIKTSGGSTTIEGSEFQGNSAANFGGAIGAFGGAITIRDTAFSENGSGQFGGAIYANSAAIDFSGIEAVENGFAEFGDHGTIIFSTFGGGAVYTTNANGRIDRSMFISNRSFAGGGVYVAGGGTVEIVNTVLTGALSSLGGGVYANASSPRIINSTIINNGDGGVFTTFNANPLVRNTVLSGNESLAAIEIFGNGLTDLSTSLVNGSFTGVDEGTGILQASPQLDTEFRPVSGSPVIDAGDNSALPADVTVDLLGNQRVFDAEGTGDARVDLGAIEFGSLAPGQSLCPADMDNDGQLGYVDVAIFITMHSVGDPRVDMNDDGATDFVDVSLFLNMFTQGCP